MNNQIWELKKSALYEVKIDGNENSNFDGYYLQSPLGYGNVIYLIEKHHSFLFESTHKIGTSFILKLG